MIWVLNPSLPRQASQDGPGSRYDYWNCCRRAVQGGFGPPDRLCYPSIGRANEVRPGGGSNAAISYPLRPSSGGKHAVLYGKSRWSSFRRFRSRGCRGGAAMPRELKSLPASGKRGRAALRTDKASLQILERHFHALIHQRIDEGNLSHDWKCLGCPALRGCSARRGTSRCRACMADSSIGWSAHLTAQNWRFRVGPAWWRARR